MLVDYWNHTRKGFKRWEDVLHGASERDISIISSLDRRINCLLVTEVVFQVVVEVRLNRISVLAGHPTADIKVF